jgi:hypothetical protein
MKTLVCFGLLASGVALAQQPASGTVSRPPGSLRPAVPRTGRITVHAHPREEVVSLDQLISMSSVILDGTVMSALPAIQSDPGVPDAIETHSVVNVNSILSGALSGDVRTFTLAQAGGRIGGLELVPLDDPIPSTGERYLLFLVEDKRKEPGNATGLPRYFSVGVFAGKVKIENERVRFPLRGRERFRAYHGADIDAFKKILDGKIHHREMPTKKNAIPHPGLGNGQGR